MQKHLSWNSYCPRMNKLMTWNDVKRERINREAEMMIADRKVAMPNNKLLVVHIKGLRKERWQPGLYNFVRYTIHQFMV